jgi:uncharacterized membrane protein YeaQ/YmgE (transglycosylase-associated protein family)
MKTFWTILGLIGFLSGAALVVFWGLSWTSKAPPDAAVAISAGVMGLVTGLFCLRDAFSKAGPGAKWRGSEVPGGRLTTFAIGLAFCVFGLGILGHGWLAGHAVPALLLLVAYLGSFVLVIVSAQLDARRYQASRSAIRRRGWLLASRRADDDLPADEVHRRQNARDSLRLSIQRRLTGRTSWERVESHCRFPAVKPVDLAAPSVWPEVAHATRSRSIQEQLPARTTREQVEERCRYVMAPARDLAAPSVWPDIADEWQAFRSAATEIDELWAFNTVSARDGRDCGEEGYALLRDGRVVDWFITAVVG